MKKLSVIVPCYNAEDYIDRCLDSLVHQTIGIDSLELILVNDGSTDETLAHLLEYEKQYPESVIVINCEQNRRQGTARNIGLTYATTDYVGYVDADDWCEYDMFERMYDNAVAYDTDVVVCDLVRDAGGAIAVRHPENNHLVVLETGQQVSDAIANWIMGEGPYARICKRQLLVDNSIYFAEDMLYEDAFWISLLHVYTRSIYFMDEELYHYYVNPQSTVLSRNTDTHLQLLDVALLTWKEYKKRGLLECYKDALEHNFIRIFYFMGLKMLALRYDHPPYQVFLYMTDVLKETVPDWRDNYYVRETMFPFYRRLLSVAELNPSEDDFNRIMQMIRDAGI